MAAVYEDNFGFWEIDGPKEQAFFEYVQRQSVEKTCCRCERPVAAHAVQNPMRLLRHRARMRRASLNEPVLTTKRQFCERRAPSARRVR